MTIAEWHILACNMQNKPLAACAERLQRRVHPW